MRIANPCNTGLRARCCRVQKHVRQPVMALSIQDMHSAIQLSPPVAKAAVQLVALLGGGATGGLAGVILEEHVIRRSRGGFISGIYGLLIGAPAGAVILSIIATLWMS